MYTGPYHVMECCGPVNYRLRKNANSRSFIAHVDKLRLCLKESMDEQTEEWIPATEPPEVVNARPKRTIRLPTRFQ